MSLRSKREHSYPEAKAKRKKSTEVKCEQNAVAKYKSKLKPCENVKIGEVLLCKMRGYCEWPCLVTGFEKNPIEIEFFGDHTSHKAAISNFFSFVNNSDNIISNLKPKKNTLYRKSVIEAEMLMGVPSEESILNRII